MPDVINAPVGGSETDSQFKPHPVGQYPGACVDVIDLGERVEAYPGSPEKLKHKVALVFWTDQVNPETGKHYEVSVEMTLSMNEKAALRKFLAMWRGRDYTEAELEALGGSVPLHKLHLQKALLTIEHKTSAAGRTYAKVNNISMLPKQMANDAPAVAEYLRPEFWAERKKEYAETAAQYRAKHAPKSTNGDDEFPPPFEDDIDSENLPF